MAVHVQHRSVRVVVGTEIDERSTWRNTGVYTSNVTERTEDVAELVLVDALVQITDVDRRMVGLLAHAIRLHLAGLYRALELSLKRCHVQLPTILQLVTV